MITQTANRLWLLSQKKKYKQFLRNADRLSQVQNQKLTDYLNENKNTDFGKKHAFRQIKTYEDYARAVPLIEDYDQISPFIERMMQGERDVLFKGKALFFESTSGSSGKAKHIPFNKQLKQELDSAISAWMWNLFRMNPLTFKGKFYWSLSPAVKRQQAAKSKIPIGADSDTNYFNPWAALLLRQIMAVQSPRNYRDADDFYLQTWKQLLETKTLSFISVWSPQFLLRLTDFLRKHQKEILNDLNCSKSRKQALQNALNKDIVHLPDLFPELQFVSCWTQAQSSIWLSELRARTQHIPIQGKGLLSTEGVVSIPWGMTQHLLSYRAHFYEFKAADNQLYLAHQLEEGLEYECIITTGGGLYRYNTNDVVRCKGYWRSIPKLEFVGRSGNISDLVGEKLSERSLTDIFLKAKEQIKGIKSIFLFPHKKKSTAEYGVLLTGVSNEAAKTVRDLVHQELLHNPYYRQAIDAGQLQPIALQCANEETIEKLSRAYQKKKEIKDGDLKLPLLFPVGYWEKLKKGEYS